MDRAFESLVLLRFQQKVVLNKKSSLRGKTDAINGKKIVEVLPVQEWMANLSSPSKGQCAGCTKSVESQTRDPPLLTVLFGLPVRRSLNARQRLTCPCLEHSVPNRVIWTLVILSLTIAAGDSPRLLESLLRPSPLSPRLGIPLQAARRSWPDVRGIDTQHLIATHNQPRVSQTEPR